MSMCTGSVKVARRNEEKGEDDVDAPLHGLDYTGCSLERGAPPESRPRLARVRGRGVRDRLAGGCGDDDRLRPRDRRLGRSRSGPGARVPEPALARGGPNPGTRRWAAHAHEAATSGERSRIAA